MSFTDSLGYAAAFLVLLTFSMKTMVPLRAVGILSNFFFLAYGYFTGALPILLLHAVLLPLNIFRLHQILSLVRRIEDASRGDINLDWLKAITTRRAVKAGEILFRKGDSATSMIFIVTGAFRIPTIGIALGAGQVIGELGLLAPGKTRTQTVDCIADSEVLEITYEQVRHLYFQNPKFGFYFLQLASRRLFENIERQDKELALYRAAAKPA